MLTLKFKKRHFLSSTFSLTLEGKEIGRLDFDARHWGATATYGEKVWRFVRPTSITRLSDIYLHDTKIGTWGDGNFLWAITPNHKISLIDGRTFLYRSDFWNKEAALKSYANEKKVVAQMDMKRGIVTVPDASEANDDAVFLAFLLEYTQLDNQISIGPMSGHMRVFYMLSKIDPA